LYIPKLIPEKNAKIDVSKITYKKMKIQLESFRNGINSNPMRVSDENLL
tara:strand:- start:109 stop:255 length:147 start_codon:yes stop_codon:yes gene_type:complete